MPKINTSKKPFENCPRFKVRDSIKEDGLESNFTQLNKSQEEKNAKRRKK